MLVSDSKDGREEPHWPDGTGRGGALEGLNTQWGMGGGDNRSASWLQKCYNPNGSEEE